MIELERTYLAKKLPDNLREVENKEIIDVYLPKDSKHPVLRLRKNGDRYEMTKKAPVKGNDSSKQLEQTIVLDRAEFEALRKIPGKVVSKQRYLYPYKGSILEFDVFKDALKGLVVVDVEFETEEGKDNFEMPEFCLVEVTQEKFIAGGMLCGAKYEDIEEKLDKLDYRKIIL